MIWAFSIKHFHTVMNSTFRSNIKLIVFSDKKPQPSPHNLKGVLILDAGYMSKSLTNS